MNATNSIEWWMTTKSSPDIFKERYRTKEMDVFISKTYGVDPAILAVETCKPESFVRLYQIRLGLRKCRPSNPRTRAENFAMSNDRPPAPPRPANVDPIKKARCDKMSKITYMAHGKGYVMVRRSGRIPFILTEIAWRALPEYSKTASEGK